jgi:putative transposase
VSKLLRYYKEGQVYFITSVTRDRRPILVEHFGVFGEAIKRTRDRIPIDLIAWVVLPDHFHMIMSSASSDPSAIIRRLKLSFDNLCYRRKNISGGGLWQARFWDHIIRDDTDMNGHIDYIHYNPVKHGHVRSPFAWRHSSLAEYYEKGLYTEDWGVKEPLEFSGEFGE